MAKEYSLRQISKGRELSQEHLDTTPLFIPVGYTQPETLNDCLNRILSHSAGQGMTLQQAYDMITGEYDDDEPDDFDEREFGTLMDDDDDGFEQSPRAQYADIPALDTPAPSAPVPTAPSVAQQPAEATAQESGADKVTDSNMNQ